MRILLTNDDGIHAEGLRALEKAVPQGIEYVLVAPLDHASATGHSISLYQSIEVEKIKRGKGKVAYGIRGTPVDCVKFALCKLKFRPDLLLSGINLGPNTGVSVFYSGTVSAAREALFAGIPSMAISLAGFKNADFGVAASFVKQFIKQYQRHTLPTEFMLNVNVPILPSRSIKGVKITRQAPSHFMEEFIEEKSRLGVEAYKLVGAIHLHDADGTSDEEAIAQGYISVSPLHVDLTAYHEFEFLKRWYLSTKNGAARKGNGQRKAFKLH